MEPIIRQREEKDLRELSHNIAVIWNDTYKGIVDETFLKELYMKEDESSELMKKLLKEQSTYYVMQLNDKIIGWVYFTYDSDSYKNAGEIHALYLLKEYHGKGYGRKLFNFAKNQMVENGLSKMVIGCLDGNPSNDFYKHIGGRLIGSRLFRERYKENLYLFDI